MKTFRIDYAIIRYDHTYGFRSKTVKAVSMIDAICQLHNIESEALELIPYKVVYKPD